MKRSSTYRLTDEKHDARGVHFKCRMALTLVRSFILALVSILSLGLLPAGDAAAQYPERNITIIVPMAPGGYTDILARLIGNQMREKLGRPVIVENKPGAGATIGTLAAARANPDGYTLLSIADQILINQYLYKNIAYDAVRDFVPVTELLISPMVIFVRADSPIKSFSHLLEMTRKEPNRFNYASPGNGSSPHIAMEALKAQTGMSIQHVAYPGAAPQMQAIMGGTIEVGTLGLAGPYKGMKSGQLRGLLILDDKRWSDLPDLPTAKELGIAVPTAVWYNTQAIYAPAGTPKEVVDKIAQIAIDTMTEPENRRKWEGLGNIVTAKGPQALGERMRMESPVFREIITSMKIKVD